MKNVSDLGQTEFDALLGLLSGDRNEAGLKYEQLREGLLRYFIFKGCSDPPRLVDETFDRVAAKVDTFDPQISLRPDRFFYGFAAHIVKEDQRKAVREQPLEENEPFIQAELPEPQTDGPDLDCLNTCLNQLDPADKKLVLEYHSISGKSKSAVRQEMFDRLNLTSSAFYTKISRVKAKLRKCVAECKQSRM